MKKINKSIRSLKQHWGLVNIFLYYIMCLTSTIFATLPPRHQAPCSCVRQSAVIALKEMQVIHYSDEGQRMT